MTTLHLQVDVFLVPCYGNDVPTRERQGPKEKEEAGARDADAS